MNQNQTYQTYMEEIRVRHRLCVQLIQMRLKIEKMQDGQRKRNALRVWHILVELCL